MKTGLQKWACAHARKEDDGEYAICVECGAVFPTKLTVKLLTQTVEAAKKH
jgi:hypothetical protein